MKILDVSFPPAVGYRTGKTYAYVSDDPKAEEAMYAVVQDPQGMLAFTKVRGVRSYQPQPFKMKHVVKVITATDIVEHQAKKEA